MPGTSLPRTFEEWQKAVNRQLAENRRGPIQLISSVRDQVEVIEQTTRRTPTNPVEITWQTAVYTAQLTQSHTYTIPYTAVRLSVDFPDVTKATDGTDITVDRYELWGYDDTPNVLEITTSAVPGKAVPGMTAPGLVQTDENVGKVDFANPPMTLFASSATSSFRAEDFIPGRTYKFYVRAMTLGEIVPGKFSAPFTVVMGKDTTPPGQPTAPVVTSERGQLIVTWNGQAVNGAMPADFTHAILTMGTESSPETEVAKFGRSGGTYIAAAHQYYEVLFFRLRAFDESGNESPWSEQAFGYPQPLVDTDIILSTLDAAKTHLINVDAGVSILENTIIAEHLVATEAMSAKLGQFLYLKAGQIDVNDLWADNAFLGYAEAKLIRADMFIGKAFEGGTFTLTQGGKFQTSSLDLRGVKVTGTGIQAWNPVGTQTFDLQASTGNITATGIFQTSPSGTRTVLWDHGDGIAALDMYPDGSAAHGAIFSQPTTGGTLGGYSTSVQHYIDSGNYSAQMTLYHDGSWALGKYGTPATRIFGDAATGTSIFTTAGGSTNNMTLDSAGQLNLYSDQTMRIQALGPSTDFYTFVDRDIYVEATGGYFNVQAGGSMNIASETGMNLDGGNASLQIRGRLPNTLASMANQSIYIWRTGASQNVDTLWNLTYAEPTPSGTRYPIITFDAAVPARGQVYNASGSGFSVRAIADGANSNITVKYLGIWTTS